MTQSMMAAVQCGAHYVLHAAGFLDGLPSMSFEKFVLDCDLCGVLPAYLKGLDTSEDPLGFEALAEGGPGAHMSGAAHTLRHHEAAYWDSGMDDHETWETWDERGRVDAIGRAETRWKGALAAYEPPMDAGVEESLLDYVARRKASMPDLWY